MATTATASLGVTLADLALRLSLAFWCERHIGSRLTMLAGSRGVIRPAANEIEIVLRPRAVLHAVRKQLIAAGVLAEHGGELTLARMPSGAEAASLCDLVGLTRLRVSA
jgi:hypothetical protein